MSAAGHGIAKFHRGSLQIDEKCEEVVETFSLFPSPSPPPPLPPPPTSFHPPPPLPPPPTSFHPPPPLPPPPTSFHPPPPLPPSPTSFHPPPPLPPPPTSFHPPPPIPPSPTSFHSPSPPLLPPPTSLQPSPPSPSPPSQFPPPPTSMHPPPPPPPLLPPPISLHPPPPPPLPPPPNSALFNVEKSKFFKMIAERNTTTTDRPEDIKHLLKNRRDSFREGLKWLLYHSPLPSLIQEGPQCGLVALWMTGVLLKLNDSVSLDTIVQVARERGYTAQGEMFSAANMALLAREVFHCGTELLEDGMNGVNFSKILHHLTAGWPVLVPYDEDCNHEPCSRGGHRAHWAAVSGVLLGLRLSSTTTSCQEDPDVPGIFHPHPDSTCPLDLDMEEVFLLAKQGKSQRSQLWRYQQVCDSNLQLLDLDPKRASDGKTYVLPEGGVKAGLSGKTLLLYPGPAQTMNPGR